MQLPENPKQSRKSEADPKPLSSVFHAQSIIIIFLCSRAEPTIVSPASKGSAGQRLFHRDCVSTSVSLFVCLFVCL